VPDVEWFRVVNATDVDRICERQSRDHINLVNGFRGFALAELILQKLGERQARIGIITERPDTRGFGRYVRRALYFSRFLRLRRKVDFTLAMGKSGEKWYRELGWPAATVFPYAYITDCAAPRSICHGAEGRGFGIIFIGQFISRKGGDILLRALATITDREWTCVFVGTGDQRDSWDGLSSRLGISERVRFCSGVEMHQIYALISKFDLLVLPSRFDGWGAVINEALMVGVPAVCSSTCGAQDLLDGGVRGEVFEDRSVRHLADILRRRIQRGPTSPETRQIIRDWACRISGDSTAEYLTQIVDHIYGSRPRPVAPWLA
jgi:glycosyltransferase involved in cell wall biosynthesis